MSKQPEITLRREPPPIALAGFALALLLFSIVLVRYTDNFFADDSYFYLEVASNLARGLGSTFNGIMPTNGYHPLWMLMCTAIFWFFPAKPVAVHTVGVVLSVLNVGTVALLSRALIAGGARCWWIAWLLYVPFCFTSQLGTEGALSGLCLAALLLAVLKFVRGLNAAAAVAVSTSAGLAVLSRLDNVFVAGSLCIALVLYLWKRDRRAVVRLFCASPIALGLGAAYLASNLRWFGTLQPISGMLKAHNRGEHNLFTNLPHTAYLDLAIILPGVVLLALVKRDAFSRVIEIPFAAGVLLHAAYITFVMSSETRWSWYYTSWTLLASLVLARLFSLWMEGQPQRRLQIAKLASAALLLIAWEFTSFHRMAFQDRSMREQAFQQHVTEAAHIRTALAFDKPGRIAFYTGTRVVPLDGLMGSLQFQKDLADRGIVAFDEVNQVDGFIGPPQPMSDEAKANFCDRVFLSSVRFHCVAVGEHLWRTDNVEVFARLTGRSAGVLNLPAQDLIWTEPHGVAVWRLPSTPVGARR